MADSAEMKEDSRCCFSSMAKYHTHLINIQTLVPGNSVLCTPWPCRIQTAIFLHCLQATHTRDFTLVTCCGSCSGDPAKACTLDAIPKAAAWPGVAGWLPAPQRSDSAGNEWGLVEAASAFALSSSCNSRAAPLNLFLGLADPLTGPASIASSAMSNLEPCTNYRHSSCNSGAAVLNLFSGLANPLTGPAATTKQD